LTVPFVNVDELAARATAAIRSRLNLPTYSGIIEALGQCGTSAGAHAVLSGVSLHPESVSQVAKICALRNFDSLDVAHVILLRTCEHSMPAIEGLPVGDGVKRLILDDFECYANPPANWGGRFAPEGVCFREMAMVATLRRFPAGQFHWELSGFPRSWIPKASSPLRLLRDLLFRLGGTRPLLETHLNRGRRRLLVLSEKNAEQTYFHAAQALTRQPHVKGLFSASWLFCEATAQVTPRLRWLRETPLSGGASIFDLGPADPESGFLTGSEERKALYEKGLYKPRFSCLLWPRHALIRWAEQYRETT
jgi:hypothetical protein